MQVDFFFQKQAIYVIAFFYFIRIVGIFLRCVTNTEDWFA